MNYTYINTLVQQKLVIRLHCELRQLAKWPDCMDVAVQLRR